MVYRRSVKRRRESQPGPPLLIRQNSVNIPRQRRHSFRRSLSADGLPRSRTSEWNNHLAAVSQNKPGGSCRPQSAFFSTNPIQAPHLPPVIFRQNDLLNKRRGSQIRDRASIYELSQDLLDRQIALLEKKYGGRIRARRAALIIQCAFRQYSMQKKFNHLASTHAPVVSHAQPRAFSVYETSEDMAIVSQRFRRSMPRSTSATGRFYPQKVVEVSPNTGLYDNLAHVRSEVNQLQYKMDKPVPGPFPVDFQSSSMPDGSNHSKSSRSRRDAAERESKGPETLLVNRLPDNNSVTFVHSASTATTTSALAICDNSSLSTSVPSEISSTNTSPVWKRQEDVADEDSGVGSLGQLNGSPTHTAFLDYDNIPSILKTTELVAPNVVSNLQASPKRLYIRKEVSPRRNSETSRVLHAVNRQSQRRAASTSRIAERPKLPKMSETERKRQYRVGLNLFNKKPERGIEFLVDRGFVMETPAAVARFLISRKGLSKQKIGEYLGGQLDFCVAALQCFAAEIDLGALGIDQALRKFQTYFRLPGEAQKIERVMEVFANRYLMCNPPAEHIYGDSLTVLRIAYGIILLNTDLHNPSIKKERKMKLEDFLKNMRGALGPESNVDDQTLRDMYMRVKADEFKPGNDHVSQVQRVDKQIIGDNKPVLPVAHRRLVCFCRLYELFDENKKERTSAHQREVFLFNDIMVVTKQNGGKKKNSPIIYRYRSSIPLAGTDVREFSTAHHPNGLKIINRLTGKVLIMLNARNDLDRDKFIEDLRESIAEMDEMEGLRIEAGLEKQQPYIPPTQNRDSGVVDSEDAKSSSSAGSSSPDPSVPKRPIVPSNSMLEITEQQPFKSVPPLTRRLSTGSLDSGMCMPGSSAASMQSTPSTDGPIPSAKAARISVLGNLFFRKGSKHQM